MAADPWFYIRKSLMWRKITRLNKAYVCDHCHKEIEEAPFMGYRGQYRTANLHMVCAKKLNITGAGK